MSLDGIYIENSNGEPAFQRVGPPSDAEVARVADRVHRRVMHLIEQRGIGRQADPVEADMLRRDEPLLAELYSASITGRVAMGPHAGKRIARVCDGPDSKDAEMKSGRCCAMVEGFSIHAGVCMPARDRIRLERLLRYAARPPLSTERLSLMADGKLLYKLKRRWRDGTTHVIYEPMELMERLAALVVCSVTIHVLANRRGTGHCAPPSAHAQVSTPSISAEISIASRVPIGSVLLGCRSTEYFHPTG